MTSLLEFTEHGLYCPVGQFYIDPWKPVSKALITHAHSDHARWGHQHYLAQHQSLPILKHRLGEQSYQGVGWKETLLINGVSVQFYPAGHIIGSAQILLSYRGERVVISGDYKLNNDGISTPFEPVKCHHFITESTFGLPIYQWESEQKIFDEIDQWIHQNREKGKTSLLLAYSLGKAQRLIKALDQRGHPIYAHGAICQLQETLLQAGHNFPKIHPIGSAGNKEDWKNGVVLAPPGAADTSWSKRFQPISVGICSGWMQVRGHKRRRNADAGFVLSDHADWKELLQAIAETEAEHIYVTHGFQSAFSRFLKEQGKNAYEVKTLFSGETESETNENSIDAHTIEPEKNQ